MIRGPLVAFHAACIVVGISMFSQLPQGMIAARYAGVFLTCGGSNANIAMIISWTQTSIRAQSKRGFASALVVAGGALSGIIVAVAFKETEAKTGYPTGIFLSIAMNALVVIIAPILSFWMLWKNRKADRGETVIEHDVNFHYQP
jgi:nitrate/nitrite transporter NarK